MRTSRRTLLLVSLLAYASVTAAAAQSAPAGPPPRAEILWDRWGVPHVYGADEEAISRAFGWAQARSHGDLLLRMYGQARGRGAEYWGERFLESDRSARRMGIPGRAREWYRAQTPEGRRRLDAFAAGVNAYAAAHADRIADRYEAVLPVTGEDVLAHVQRVIHFNFLGDPRAVAAGIPGVRAGSNAWAVAPSRAAGGNAMLLANPHLPWGDIFTWYEAQLTGPGVDVYGAALVGFPFIGVGFNDRLGWTHTVNTLDGADVYALTLAEGGYRWDGGVRPFETRREVIRVRRDDGSLRDDTLLVRASVHGPVLGERGGTALAYRVVGLDQPFLADQYWQMARARDLAEFEGAVKRLQMPMFTVMYADRDGHILHLFNGRVPVRSRGDWAFWHGVVRGDTSATLWTRTHAYGDLPRVLDPPSGWLQNANDPPWTTTFPSPLRPESFPAYMAPVGMEFRPQRSARMVMADSSISLDEMVAYKHSTRMELADRVLDDLLAAVRERGTPAAREAAAVLERWNHDADADSRGAVLFLAWVRTLMERSGGVPFATGWNPSAPLATPDGLADPAAAVAALEAAATLVRGAYGALDVPWGEVNRLRRDSLDLPANGGPDEAGVFRALWSEPEPDGRFVAGGGDSFVAAVEFGRTVRAKALLGYGNASQPGSPHRTDQLPLFARKELRPVWRTRAEVEANLESRERF